MSTVVCNTDKITHGLNNVGTNFPRLLVPITSWLPVCQQKWTALNPWYGPVSWGSHLSVKVTTWDPFILKWIDSISGYGFAIPAPWISASTINQGLWNAYDLATHANILACKIPWTEGLVGPWGHKESDTMRWLSTQTALSTGVDTHTAECPSRVLCHSKGDSEAEIEGYVIIIARRTWFRTNPLKEEKVGAFSTNHSPSLAQGCSWPISSPCPVFRLSTHSSYLNALNKETHRKWSVCLKACGF